VNPSAFGLTKVPLGIERPVSYYVTAFHARKAGERKHELDWCHLWGFGYAGSFCLLSFAALRLEQKRPLMAAWSLNVFSSACFGEYGPLSLRQLPGRRGACSHALILLMPHDLV